MSGPDGVRVALVTIDNGEDHTKPTFFGRSALKSLERLLPKLEEGSWDALVLTGKPFVFAAGASSVGAPDTVGDFRHGFDTLVIRSGHDAGTFLAGGAFTGTGGIEVRWAAGLHQLQVDLTATAP